MELRFVQIICGQWEQDDQRLQNVVFGLTAEGRVFKFVGSGWRELPANIVSRET